MLFEEQLFSTLTFSRTDKITTYFCDLNIVSIKVPRSKVLYNFTHFKSKQDRQKHLNCLYFSFFPH